MFPFEQVARTFEQYTPHRYKDRVAKAVAIIEANISYDQVIGSCDKIKRLLSSREVKCVPAIDLADDGLATGELRVTRAMVALACRLQATLIGGDRL